MKITWLGQAGLFFENENIKIIIDPYLSNSCGELNFKSYRRTPVNEKFFKIKPDVIVLTHNHLDHTDIKTLEFYLSGNENVTVLASENAWNNVRQLGGRNNYVLFNRHTEWTQNGVKFAAVKAEHSDNFAVGVIIDDGYKKYYITGDTLYNTEIFEDIPQDINVVFLPINGAGNNMNMYDASRFAKKIGAANAVPVHFGMFDEIDPNFFECDKKIIPKIYDYIELD